MKVNRITIEDPLTRALKKGGPIALTIALDTTVATLAENSGPGSQGKKGGPVSVTIATNQTIAV